MLNEQRSVTIAASPSIPLAGDRGALSFQNSARAHHTDTGARRRRDDTMAKRVCAEPGCPELTDVTRCWTHARQKDKARGTSGQRGYGGQHQALRADWQRRIDRGDTVRCWRPDCLTLIRPGDEWALGHCDIDRRIYHGPECTTCNNATSGRVGCPHPSHDMAA